MYSAFVCVRARGCGATYSSSDKAVGEEQPELASRALAFESEPWTMFSGELEREVAADRPGRGVERVRRPIIVRTTEIADSR